MYVNMDEMLRKAGPENYAVPAFNIVNGVMASAVIDAAASCGSAVILQVSEKPSKTIGPKRVADFVRPLAEDAPIPVALHLDHCTDQELAKHCVDVGYSSIMIDMSKKPLEENIRVCAEIAAYAHKSDVSVEGEIGAIVGVEDNIKITEREAALADVDSSKLFVEKTGVDFLAPAIGRLTVFIRVCPK